MKKKTAKTWRIVIPVNDFKRFVLKERISAENFGEADKKFKKLVDSGKLNDICESIKLYIDEFKTCDSFLHFKLEEQGTQNWRIWRWKGKPVSFSLSASDKHIAVLDIYQAKTREEAFRHYRKFVKENKLTDCYYSTAFGYMHEDPNIAGLYVDQHGLLAGLEDLETDEKTRVSSERYQENLKNFIDTGHAKNEWYSLYNHIIGDLIYNIPIMIKKCAGYPSCCKSIKDWKKALADFHEHLMLYVYYSEFGIVDSGDPEMTKIEKKYKKNIPYYEGTYRDIDYGKLNALVEKEWKYVMKWLTENMRNLWD